jgi:hypothetical protein
VKFANSLKLEALRNLHRPKNQDELRVACHELRSRGFGDHGIASATGLSVEAVRRLLGER